MRRIVTGNQAVALGALRSGVRVVTGYPGTPSTGVVEHLLGMRLPDRHVEWSTNEKVAFEIAAGAAWAGQRALVTMKMSGVNVAYDALISIAYSGTNGGLVIYVADDPGVSAGMAEQDSRGFALLSDLPMLEPATVAEAYELSAASFEVSERARTPVFLRLTTAVALTHATVDLSLDTPPSLARDPVLERSIAKYTKAGAKICLDQHRGLVERLRIAGGVIRAMGLNDLALAGKPGGLGIVAVGPTYAYLAEGLASAGLKPSQVSVLKAVTTTPFPGEEAETLLRHCGSVLVLEELEPFFERELWIAARKIGRDVRIVGKLDGTLSRSGEYGVEEVARGLVACSSWPVEGQPVARGTWDVGTAGKPQATSHKPQAGAPPSPQAVSPAPRPITVCAGCPHRGTYMAIEAAIKKAGFAKDAVMVTGDIGCTILGMNPPFELVWNEVSMGSSVSLAQGYVHAGIQTPVIATIGDSTFFHAGIPGLLNAVQHKVPLTVVVMDNGWTAMTGMQVNPGTDDAFQGGGRRVDLAKILPALGADRFDVVDPYDLPAMTAVLAEGLKEPGVKVVLAQRECAIQARRRGVAGAIVFDEAKCVLCKRCLKVTGCPGLSLADDKINVDAALCNGCGLCAGVCPVGALTKESR